MIFTLVKLFYRRQFCWSLKGASPFRELSSLIFLKR